MFGLAKLLIEKDPALRVLCTTTTKMIEPTSKDCNGMVVSGDLSNAIEDIKRVFGDNGPVAFLAKGYVAHEGSYKKVIDLWCHSYLICVCASYRSKVYHRIGHRSF